MTRSRAAQRRRRPPLTVLAAIEYQAPLEMPVQAPTSARGRITRKRSGSRDPRYSSARWLRESRAYLAAHPLCQCEDACGQSSAFVDHHAPVKDGGDFWDRANWRALADRCHRLKSRIEQGQRGELAPVMSKPLRIKGADVNGYPRDPAHPWHRS